ncbi:unnamed protein product [Sphagnum jensenii]|uniref:Serine-threonine/tyrosine-protein kinase catalytic domain-containing protein n=1 Tax=Sphagnum jensenii TaxID=128206 RepID=A0ABP0VSX9_9BRYO
MYGRVNDKADVYTFGVVLLELITDCRAIEPERLEGKDQLIIWGRPLLDERSLDKLVDPWLGRTCNVCQMQTIISAAALCLQPSSQHQPQIKQIRTRGRSVHSLQRLKLWTLMESDEEGGEVHIVSRD